MPPAATIDQELVGVVVDEDGIVLTDVDEVDCDLAGWLWSRSLAVRWLALVLRLRLRGFRFGR